MANAQNSSCQGCVSREEEAEACPYLFMENGDHVPFSNISKQF